MSSDLNTLLQSQNEIHGRISRSVENLKKMGANHITLSAIETRIKILDQLWIKFEAQHDLLRAGYKEKFNTCEYMTSDIFEITENAYVMQRSALDEYAERYKIAPVVAAPRSEHGHDHAPKTSLPRIKLQQFSGVYADWPSFRDLFLSVIGKNASISNIERFHYLRSCLQGPAEKLIRSLTVTSENYERAWAILSKHYENKKELIRSNFAAFTIVAKMKGETADELSRIYNAVTTAVNAQESIGRPIESHGMDLFNHLVVELFDPHTRLEWESSTCGSFDPPDHETLTNFITTRILTLNAAKPKITTKGNGDTSRTAKTHLAKRGSEPQCALCHEKHILMQCREFKAKSANERKKIIENCRLCFNCLGNHPIAKCQSTRTCFTCKARHYSMLHAYVPPKQDEVSALSAVRKVDERTATLLATARVIVTDRHGDPHTIRALIDQGSEVSIVSEALVQRLRLRRSHTSVSISGIGGASTGATRGKVSLSLSSKVTAAAFSAVAYILPRLSAYQGSTARNHTAWPHLHGLPLADPLYMEEDPVELLLGAEVCSIILEDGLRKGGPRAPIAQRTSLGWILSGGCEEMFPPKNRSSHQCTADHELVDLVRSFWEQEKEPTASMVLTPDEERCEEFFVRTHKRTTSGRYVVRLPFSKTPATLAETRRPAERLLSAMERKCDQDSRFGDLYRSFMQEYEDLKHMEPIINLNRNDKGQRCFLPHHGVLRESSATTKLRVVFNGSQRTRSCESLNSCLLVGANLLPMLADVLLRWRWHRFVFIADIEKMYRQIQLHPEDRDFQRILWRHDASGSVHEYRLNTVTYGLACAPFLAIRTLRQLADDEGSRNPHAATALRRDCYVDDIVSGADTLSDAIATQTRLREICTAGGFPLRKWTANHDAILAEIPSEYQLPRTPHSWEEDSHATLGLRWHPTSDCFTFAIRRHAITLFTKRHVLSETARLFDPLGWLAPVVMRAKIFIQSAWLRQLDWDTPLPPADAQCWLQFLEELPQLERLRVDCWLNTGDKDAHLELHGFADASERGYAAVVYLRATNHGATSLHLLAAKSKVAPLKQISLKQISLPRLELCEAALLTNLTIHIQKKIRLSFSSYSPLVRFPRHTLLDPRPRLSVEDVCGKPCIANPTAASRSTMATCPRKGQPCRLRIQGNRSKRTPRTSIVVDKTRMASHGQRFLAKLQPRDSWRGATRPKSGRPQRTMQGQNRAGDPSAVFLLAQASSRDCLVPSVATHRLTHQRASSEKDGCDDPTDQLDGALFGWLRVVQKLQYSAEINALTANRSISMQSPLIKLSPFQDDNGVLRVGDRLKHAVLSPDERHPMIAPPDSWLTRLLVDAYHRRTLHGGVQLTLGLLRHRFWIPRGRAVVKQQLHRCVTCVRWRAATPQPPMGNLPRERVTPSRPFLRTGVDYAGPIFIRITKGRGHRSYKGFIAVFVCFTTKAVHLEVASDYTTEAFLAALRRFTARRGLCKDIFSDCGTNFVGADRQLQELFRASSPDGQRIAHAVSSDGMKWHFNPPAAPHFGGLWEAAVKSTKYHLRVIGETTLTYEEMCTFLTQVEACLNSTPLQALSDDPSDITALTPGHFLIGAPLLAVPEPSLLNEPENALTHGSCCKKCVIIFGKDGRASTSTDSPPNPSGSRPTLRLTSGLCA